MTSVLIDPDLSHSKAGCVGKLVEDKAVIKSVAGTLDLYQKCRVVEFNENEYLIFHESEYKIIDLTPMPPAFKDYLSKTNLINWLKDK